MNHGKIVDSFVTYLAVKEPLLGALRGRCCVCGKETDSGHPKPFSNTFTGFAHLTYGEVACPHCFSFFKNPDFRKKSWVATADGVQFLDRRDCEKVLLNPPDPPFFIYISSTGQRQGWLSALQLINWSRERFFIATDWVPPFEAFSKELHELHRILTKLRKQRISKISLRTGEFSMTVWKKAFEDNFWQDLDLVRNYRGNPLWEVLIYVSE